MLYSLLCILGLLVQIAFIIVESRKKYLPAVILKGSASIVFVTLGFLCAGAAKDAAFARLITIGLLLGALGDILLNLRFLFDKKGQAVFLAGVAAFLTGHILYLAALITIAKDPLWYLAAGAALAALLLWRIFSALGKIKASFKVFGILYIGVISMMTAVAAGNCAAALNSNPAGITGSLFFFLGALLFLASDVIMILNTFGKETRQSLRTSNLLLYYAGQLLIALSLLFF